MRIDMRQQTPEKGFGDVPREFYAPGRMGIHSVYIGEIEHVWARGRKGE